MVLGQWFNVVDVDKIPNAGHCLFDMGEGVWCTGEIVDGRCHVFGRCNYKHEDVVRFMLINSRRNNNV